MEKEPVSLSIKDENGNEIPAGISIQESNDNSISINISYQEKQAEDIHISIDLNTDTKHQPEEDEEDEDDKYLFYSPLFGFIGGSKKLDRRILKIAIAVFIGPWVVAAIFFLGLFLV